MKTYEKHARSDEQALLSRAVPRDLLQPRQKIFWRIETDQISYELISIGRQPCGIDVEENPMQLAVMPLDNNDDCFIEKQERTTGKYRVITHIYSRNSTKFDAVKIHWDNLPDWFRQSCIDIHPLAVTLQTTSKKRTHLSTHETIKSTVVRMYFKFRFM